MTRESLMPIKRRKYSLWLFNTCVCLLERVSSWESSSCIGVSREFLSVPEHRGRVMSAVGNHYQRTGEDITDWENLARILMNCRLGRSVNWYDYLYLRAAKLPINAVTNLTSLGDMFLRNATWLPTDYVASCPGRKKCTITITFVGILMSQNSFARFSFQKR